MGKGPFTTIANETGGATVLDAEGRAFCHVDAANCHGGDRYAAKGRAQRIAESLNKTEGHSR